MSLRRRGDGSAKPDIVALAALGVTYLARDHFPSNQIWVPEIGWYAASTGTMWKRTDTLAQVGVSDPVLATDVSLSPMIFTLAPGATQLLAPQVTPIGASQVVSYSYDTAKLAIVNNVLSRIADTGTPGEVLEVVASIPNGKKATSKVTLLAANLVPAPLTGIEEIWLMGASLEVGAFSQGQGALMPERMKSRNGITKADGSKIDIKLGATSGYTQTQWKATYDSTYKAQISAKSLVHAQLVGNDITAAWGGRNGDGVNNNTAWSGNTANLATRDLSRTIWADIQATGAKLIPTSISFRNYGNSDMMTKPQNGSKGFNDAFLVPDILALNPSMAYNGRPFSDLYSLFSGICTAGFITGDPTHLTPYGYAIMRNYLMDTWAARIKGVAPPVLPQDVFSRPAAPLAARIRAITGNYGLLPESTTMYNTSVMGQTAVTAGPTMSLEGYTMNSLTITRPQTTAQINDGKCATGNTTDTLLNDSVKNEAWYIATAQGVQQLMLVSGGPPGGPVRIDISSARTVAAGVVDRIGEWSVDNFATVAVENQGAAPPGVEASAKSFTANFDSSGKLEIKWRVKSGSTYAYCNGIQITPL